MHLQVCEAHACTHTSGRGQSVSDEAKQVVKVTAQGSRCAAVFPPLSTLPRAVCSACDLCGHWQSCQARPRAPSWAVWPGEGSVKGFPDDVAFGLRGDTGQLFRKWVLACAARQLRHLV